MSASNLKALLADHADAEVSFIAGPAGSQPTVKATWTKAGKKYVLISVPIAAGRVDNVET